MNETMRILVADAGAEFRALLTETLDDTPGLQVVGQTDDGGELLRMTEELRPDVVVMDLQLLHVDGVEALRQLGLVQVRSAPDGARRWAPVPAACKQDLASAPILRHLEE